MRTSGSSRAEKRFYSWRGQRHVSESRSPGQAGWRKSRKAVLLLARPTACFRIALCGALFAARPPTYVSTVSGQHGSDGIHISSILPCRRPHRPEASAPFSWCLRRYRRMHVLSWGKEAKALPPRQPSDRHVSTKSSTSNTPLSDVVWCRKLRKSDRNSTVGMWFCRPRKAVPSRFASLESWGTR